LLWPAPRILPKSTNANQKLGADDSVTVACGRFLAGPRNDPLPRPPECWRRHRLSKSNDSRAQFGASLGGVVGVLSYAQVQVAALEGSSRRSAEEWRTELSHVQQAIFVALALLAPICAARRPIAWFARCRGMKKSRLRRTRRESRPPVAHVRPSARPVARRPRLESPGRKAELVGYRPADASARYANRRSPLAS
jgi:hypothetical protein